MSQKSWDDQEADFPPATHPVFQEYRAPEQKTVYQRPSFDRRGGDRRYGGRPPASRWEPWEGMREYNEDDDLDSRDGRRIVLQVIGSAILVLATYIVFNSNLPFAEQAQRAARTVMQKETDFTAVNDWLHSHLGISSQSVTTLSPVTDNSAADDVSFVNPLAEYKLTQNFDAAKYPALLMSSAPAAEVKAVSKGEVVTVDRNEKYGIYVIVDHGEALGQTLYGHLETVAAKPGDWLYTGQPIGKIAKQEPADLYFAYRKKDKFVDPQEVLKRVKQ